MSSSKNLFDSTSIGFPKSRGTVSIFDQLLVSSLGRAHVFCSSTYDRRSWHSTRSCRTPTKRSTPLRYLQPRGPILFIRVQGCGIRRHNQVCPCSARRYVDPLTAERLFRRFFMGGYSIFAWIGAFKL